MSIAAADAAAASPHNLNAVALQLLLGTCSGDPVGHNKRPRRSNSSPTPSPYRCPSTRGLLPARKRHRVLVVTKQGQSAATDTQCARQLTSCRASRRRKLFLYPMLSDPVQCRYATILWIALAMAPGSVPGHDPLRLSCDSGMSPFNGGGAQAM